MILNPDKPFSVFSDKGNIEQRDYAMTAIMKSASAVGCGASDGCVIMSHKKLKKLIVPQTYHKVYQICPTIGITFSGLQPDFRVQLETAQRICQNYFDVYGKYPYVDVLAGEFSLEIQEYGQKNGGRPFGTYLILCGTTQNGPSCYSIDPSGSYQREEIITCGVEYQNNKKFIERRKGCLEDNISTCLSALKENVGSELTPADVSVGVYTEKNNEFKVYDYEEIKEVFDSL